MGPRQAVGSVAVRMGRVSIHSGFDDFVGPPHYECVCSSHTVRPIGACGERGIHPSLPGKRTRFYRRESIEPSNPVSRRSFGLDSSRSRVFRDREDKKMLNLAFAQRKQLNDEVQVRLRPKRQAVHNINSSVTFPQS